MYQLLDTNSKLIDVIQNMKEKHTKVRNGRNDQKHLVIDLLGLSANAFVQHIFKFHQGMTSIWI